MGADALARSAQASPLDRVPGARSRHDSDLRGAVNAGPGPFERLVAGPRRIHDDRRERGEAKMVDRRPPQAPTKNRINAILGDLSAQRKLLEASPLSRELLAANGASIAYWQSKLRHATPHHGPRPQ